MEKGVPAKVSKTLWISRRQRGRYIVSEKEIKCYAPTYRIYSIKRHGRPESGRLFESGRLLKFHHFQQVLYVEDVTSQVSVKYFDENSLFGGSLLLVLIHFVGWGRWGERGGFWLWALIELESRRGRGGRLFEVGRLFG